MKLSVAMVAPAVLILAACSSEEASQSSSSAASQTPAETTEETSSAVSAAETAPASSDAPLCLAAGPQTPRDISMTAGSNPIMFEMAPAASSMNLCNIHTHTNAEHKGPGFSVFVDDTDNGGYACNATDSLTDAELAAAPGGYEGVKPGDTIEVHWVHTSCDITPGEGLGSCLSDTCENPLLRVEAQTFLVVNDENALNFVDMAYGGNVQNGLHQAKMIPDDTGLPVVFRGSTTGPSYDQSTCSPLNVTWSVRPQCAKLDINSLHAWAESGNAFNETKSHGVRQLVTAPELLSPIE